MAEIVAEQYPKQMLFELFSHIIYVVSLKPYKPLPDFLTIGKSNIHGLGVIAKQDIDENINLGISHIKYKDYEDGLIRTPIGGFINHSDNPNCK